MIDNWLSLTYALNSLSRSLGQPDSYPFMLSPASIDKLRFIHDTVSRRTLQADGGLRAGPAVAA